MVNNSPIVPSGIIMRKTFFGIVGIKVIGVLLDFLKGIDTLFGGLQHVVIHISSVDKRPIVELVFLEQDSQRVDLLASGTTRAPDFQTREGLQIGNDIGR